MNTAVQLRDGGGSREALRCDLLYGCPLAVAEGRLGPVALFGPGELVAYRVRSRRRSRVFIVRTLAASDALAARVPGILPGVRLIATLRSAGRAQLATRLFAFLHQRGIEPASLSDTFYLRVGAALGGRLPSHKIALALLRGEPRQPDDRTPAP